MTVNLSDRSYPILLENGLLERAGQAVDLERRVLVVRDDGVPVEYSQAILAQCGEGHEAVVPRGEGSKSFARLEELCALMLDKRFSRRDCVVAVGGGVVGDLAGFAAAVYMRGVDFINVPTTTLSQVDSSIGGKVAVNLRSVKNAVGAFYQPVAVLIDPETLATLPRRHFMNGMVEAVKAGLIGDGGLFEIFEQEGWQARLPEILTRALEVKRRIVEQDERELGLRRVLNFGHTLGHGIESACGLSSLLHGEAVALGMLPMVDDPALRARLRAVLTGMGINLNTPYDAEAAYEALLRDKKARADQVTVIRVAWAGDAYQTDMTTAALHALLRDRGE